MARPVVQDQRGFRLFRQAPGIAAVFGQVQDVTVGQPGQSVGQLVSLATGGRDGHGEPGFDVTRDLALDPADMVDIGDNRIANFALDRADDISAAWRDAGNLAGKFAPVGKHAPPKQVHLHAPVAAAIDFLKLVDLRCFRCGHGVLNPRAD